MLNWFILLPTESWLISEHWAKFFENTDSNNFEQSQIHWNIHNLYWRLGNKQYISGCDVRLGVKFLFIVLFLSDDYRERKTDQIFFYILRESIGNHEEVSLLCISKRKLCRLTISWQSTSYRIVVNDYYASKINKHFWRWSHK